MGLFEDILGAVSEAGEYVTGDWGERWRPVGRALFGKGPDVEALRAEAEAKAPDVDDILAALLKERTEDVLTLARTAQTTEDLLALDQARAELVQLGTDLPVLREKIGLLENLPEFDEDATAEEIIGAFSELAPQLALEEAGEVAALTPEEQAFADLQTRSMTLDVELKEQELSSVRMANQQAGMMSLLNMLPADARASTIATIMETPGIRDELFPGLFGGGGPTPGGTTEGGGLPPESKFVLQ